MMTELMKNLSIGKRIGFGFALVLLLMGGIIVPVVINEISNVIYSAEERELRQLATSAEAEIASEARTGEALSSLVANIGMLQSSFAAGNRDFLAEQLVPAFRTMKEKYAVRQFQYHTPPATSFLRVHKPEKFGDDLSSFRTTVVDTNSSKQPVQGLEKGVAGLFRRQAHRLGRVRHVLRPSLLRAVQGEIRR